MPTAPETLLTDAGHIDHAACRALAAKRVSWATKHPRYSEHLSGAIEIANEEARMEQVRVGLSPAEIAVLDVADLRAASPYPDEETERRIRRLEIQAASDLARERAAVPMLLAAE
jgi:hypothetical protein